jgi:hypothetical protein
VHDEAENAARHLMHEGLFVLTFLSMNEEEGNLRSLTWMSPESEGRMRIATASNHSALILIHDVLSIMFQK